MSNIERHDALTTAALEWTKRFGYLRNCDYAELLYAGLPSAKRLAQRLTAKMVTDGSLIEHAARGVQSHYALRGAGDIFKQITGHRDAANEIAIKAVQQGRRVITEREIRQQQLEYYGKIPDTLFIDAWMDGSDLRRDYSWVEVENCERSGRDLITFGDWIMRKAFPRRDWHVIQEIFDGYLDRILVVISSKKAADIHNRLLNYIERNYCDGQRERDWVAEELPKRLQFISIL